MRYYTIDPIFRYQKDIAFPSGKSDVFLVEMAGFEPASERFDPRISYERSRLFLSSEAVQSAKSVSDHPLKPESSLSSEARQFKRHSGFVAPDPAIGRSSMQADVTCYEVRLLCSRLCSEGHSSIICAIGTCVLY